MKINIIRRREFMTAAFVWLVAGTSLAAQIFVSGEGLWQAPLKGRVRLKATAAPVETDESQWSSWAIQASEALQRRLGVVVSADDLNVRQVSTDAAGNVHVRLSQRYRGIPVRGNQLIVHFRQSGAAYLLNGDFISGITLDPTPVIERPKGGTLVIWSPLGAEDGSSARLAWRTAQGSRWVYTDARTGEVFADERRVAKASYGEEDESWFEEYSAKYARKARTSPFPSGVPCVIRGQLPSTLWTNDAPCVVEVPGIKGDDGYYYLCGTNRYGREFAIWNGEGVIDAYRSVAGRVLPLPTSDDVNALARFTSPDWGDFHPEAIGAAWNIVATTEYYRDEFGRATYLGAKDVRTCAFVCVPSKNASGKIIGGMENAFFYADAVSSGTEPENSGAIYFGYYDDGETSFQALDVVAHEFTHGVTTSTADFLYEGEPGAIDESFADIFGVGCENLAQSPGPEYPSFSPQSSDWFVGEDIGYVRAMRDFLNPASKYADYPQAKVYRDSNWADTTPYSEDSGGVHSNSGVQNHFFYLLQNEIGLEPALQIAYHVLVGYCSSQTDYAVLPKLWSAAAADLGGNSANGVLIPENASSAVDACWAKLKTKPAFAGNKTRDFVGVILEAGLIVDITVGKVSKGKASVAVLLVDFDGWSQTVSGTMKLSNGKAKFRSMLGTMNFDFAADNIYCTWKVSKDMLVDPSEPWTIKFMAMNRAPAFLPSLADALPPSAHAGVKLNVSVYDHLACYWADVFTFSAKNLPKGMSLNADTGRLSGVPSKAQSGTAKITVKSLWTGLSRTYSWKYSFVNLPSWARRKYGAYVTKSGTNVVGAVKLSITSAGVVSGKLKIGKGTWTLSGKGYSSATEALDAFLTTITAKKGKKSARVSITVDAGGMAGSTTINKVKYSFAGGPAISLDLDSDPLPGTNVRLVPAGVKSSIALLVSSDSPYTVTAKNLPFGLKLVKSGAGYHVSGTASKPGELATPALFTVKNYAVTGGRTFAFRFLVDNYRTDSIAISDHYDEMIAGVPSSFTIEGATNCMVKGLPAGLSFAKSTGEVSGVPKAPGKSLVTFTRTVGKGKKAKTYKASALFVVYQGAGFDPEHPGLIADALSVHASTSAVKGPDASTAEIADGGAVRIYAGVQQSIPLSVSGGLEGVPDTLACSKLPTGLSLVKSVIKGVATKPGEKKTIKVSATNKWKWTGSRTLTIEVVPLPGWARGFFKGAAVAPLLAAADLGSTIVRRRAGLEGTSSLSVTAAGKISGKYMWQDGISHSFSRSSYQGVEEGSFFALGGTSAQGKLKWSSGICVEPEDYPASDGGVIQRGVAEFSTSLKISPYAADDAWLGTNDFFVAKLHQNIWNSKTAKLPSLALTKKAKTLAKKLKGVDGYDFTFAFGAKGAVTVSVAKSGTTKKIASASSHLTLLSYSPESGWVGETAVVVPKLKLFKVFSVVIADVQSVAAADMTILESDAE